MPYHIFGNIENQNVTFIGCSRSNNIPADSILLQTVEHHPDVHWVKWCLRFADTLVDKTPLRHPYARYFKNSATLRRLFGDEDFERFSAEQNVQFLRFHEKNPQLLDELLQAALAKKAEGRVQYSMDQLLGEARWGDVDIDRDNDRLKINGRWSAWYSRVLQMVESKLIGFFAVRCSIADDLVWTDGRAWKQFASEHKDEIDWDDPFDKSNRDREDQSCSIEGAEQC
jgi:hypothetical protein